MIGGVEDISNLEPVDSEDGYQPKPPSFQQKHRVLLPYPIEPDGNLQSNQSLLVGEEEKQDGVQQHFDLKAIGKRKKVEMSNSSRNLKLQSPLQV
jgi:hypothetical protein